MNRTALKNYAPKARLDFIRAVTDRAAFFGLTPDRAEPMQETGDVVLIGGRPFPRVVAEQRKKLQERISQRGFAQVMEAMAYTWFNRFVALRYMELHGYLEHGYRVLSPAPSADTEKARHGDTEMSDLSASDRLRVSASSAPASPEILTHAEHVTLPGLDPQKVIELKLDGGQDAVLYRLLLVAQCNALHEAMPFLFEKIADETELLLPDNLLHSDSLIRKLVTELDEADWQQVEIIGWLYQFYISDKKDEVIGKVVKSEDIPAATQLFTPNWIVKYLVQNTLGRQWLATYPNSPLRQQMEYYIEPAEQTDEVKAQLAAITPKSLDPETLTLLDPASGSGHILVEAYDLFKAIYQERGYRSKDIPRLILEKNLYGLEIDDRAAQLAAFALLMKARADDRRIFTDHVQPNVIAIQESKGMEGLLRPDPAAAKGAGELPFADSDLFPPTEKQLTLNKPNQESPLAAVEPCLRELIKLFEHGKTFGSLIRVPPELAAQLPAARKSIEAMSVKGQLWENRAATLLMPLLKQAEFLIKTCDAVVTNPPYMGSKFYPPLLKQFVGEFFNQGKADLYGCFIQRAVEATKPNGFVGMITIPNWMFLSSFEELRHTLLKEQCIESFVHNGRGVWGSDFGSCTFVVRTQRLPTYKGAFKRLFDKQGSVASVEELQVRFFKAKLFMASAKDFGEVPGSPIAYWVSNKVRRVFSSSPALESFAHVKFGMSTGSGTYIRCWHEVAFERIGFGFDKPELFFGENIVWAPYDKGGSYRKWFGNQAEVVYWKNNGEKIRSNGNSAVRSPQFFCKRHISWTLVSSSAFSVRYFDKGFLLDTASNAVYPKESDSDLYFQIGFLNTNLVFAFLAILNPSVNFSCGVIGLLPVKPMAEAQRLHVKNITQKCIILAKADWDEDEISWSFRSLPLLSTDIHNCTVGDAWREWESKRLHRISEMLTLEKELTHIFVTAYDLEDEFAVELTEDSITLGRPDRERDIQKLVSYSVGCMMGRYSLDKPGLAYAHSRNDGFHASQYQTFPADADGIIPITELAWFPDDATERFVEFIGKAWPREHLEPNLKFIADSLGANRDEHPREAIRRYLSQNFYKDHLQMYKRRPIYWLFSSGKQKAFLGLVYLHRYHEGTLARMRTEYVIPLQGKLSQRIEQLAGDITAATSTSHRRKLEKERETLVKQRTELTTFDEKLRHYADQRIALDLDDGVKVNYGKFGDLLAEVKAVTGGTEE